MEKDNSVKEFQKQTDENAMRFLAGAKTKYDLLLRDKLARWQIVLIALNETLNSQTITNMIKEMEKEIENK